MQAEAVRTCMCLGSLWSSLQQHQCQLRRSPRGWRPTSWVQLLCAAITLALSNSLIGALCRCAWVHQSTCWALAVPCAAVRAPPDRKKVGFKRFRTFCPRFVPPVSRVSQHGSVAACPLPVHPMLSHILLHLRTLSVNLSLPQTPVATTHTTTRRKTRSVQVTRAQQLPKVSLRPGASAL